MSRATRMSRAERRASIVEATMPLLEQFGPLTTTKQIADSAGIAEGTIFRVFDSLQEVFEETITAALSASRLERILNTEPFPGDLEGDTRAAFDAVERYHQAVKPTIHLGHGLKDAPAGQCARGQLLERYRDSQRFLAERFAAHADALTVTPGEFARLILVLASGQHGHGAVDIPILSRDLLVACALDGVRKSA